MKTETIQNVWQQYPLQTADLHFQSHHAGWREGKQPGMMILLIADDKNEMNFPGALLPEFQQVPKVSVEWISARNKQAKLRH